MHIRNIVLVFSFLLTFTHAEEKLHLSWDQVVVQAQELHKKITEAGIKPFGIIAVTRGGLPPATLLAHLLHIKKIQIISIESYNRSKKGLLHLLHKPAIANKGKGWIVVDDIADTGATLHMIRKMYPLAYQVSLVAKPQGERIVDTYALKVPQETWVVFPWEISKEGS